MLFLCAGDDRVKSTCTVLSGWGAHVDLSLPLFFFFLFFLFGGAEESGKTGRQVWTSRGCRPWKILRLSVQHAEKMSNVKRSLTFHANKLVAPLRQTAMRQLKGNVDPGLNITDTYFYGLSIYLKVLTTSDLLSLLLDGFTCGRNLICDNHNQEQGLHVMCETNIPIVQHEFGVYWTCQIYVRFRVTIRGLLLILETCFGWQGYFFFFNLRRRQFCAAFYGVKVKSFVLQ